MFTHREELSTKLRNVPIADTPDGTSWAIKALHPADHEAVPRGMPTRDATSVVNMQFQREYLVPAPKEMSEDGTWDIDLWLFRDPMLFGSMMITADDGAVTKVATIENRQLGATWAEGIDKLRDLCEAFRVSYQSVTGVFVAPYTANQGTVRAAQYDYPAYIRPYVPAASETGVGLMTTDAVTFPDAPLPYGSLIQMPNAYINEAKEGFYMPLKLTERDMQWTVTNQTRILYGRPNSDGQSLEPWPIAPGRRWPYYSETEALVYGYKPGDLIGHVAFRGLSKQASINFTVRCGVDMKVRPETTYSPFNHEPPVYDSTAIKMYFEIARRMADAYPAKYNDTGALLQVVASIAQSLWPLVQPKAKELLEKLTSKINSKVQTVVNHMTGRANTLPQRGPTKVDVPRGKPLPPKPQKKQQ